MAQVPLDGVLGEEQRLGDAAVRLSGGGELGDAPLAGGQRVEPGDRGATGPGAAGQKLLAGAPLERGRPALVGQTERAAQRIAAGDAPPRAPERRAEIVQRVRELQRRVGLLKGCNGVLERRQPRRPALDDAAGAQRGADRRGQGELPCQPELLVDQAQRLVAVAAGGHGHAGQRAPRHDRRVQDAVRRHQAAGGEKVL